MITPDASFGEIDVTNVSGLDHENDVPAVKSEPKQIMRMLINSGHDEGSPSAVTPK